MQHATQFVTQKIPVLKIASAFFATKKIVQKNGSRERAFQDVKPAFSPAPFFSGPIWTAIFGGLNLYGAIAGKQATPSAKRWHKLNMLFHGISSWANNKNNFIVERATSLGMLASAFAYRSRLNTGDRGFMNTFVRWCAELYAGWMVNSVVIEAAIDYEKKNPHRSETQQMSRGLLVVGGLTLLGAIVTAKTQWRGVPASFVWGLTGAVANEDNAPPVRTAAILSAGYFLYKALEPRSRIENRK